jgi:hypothetical protein
MLVTHIMGLHLPMLVTHIMGLHLPMLVTHIMSLHLPHVGTDGKFESEAFVVGSKGAYK